MNEAHPGSDTLAAFAAGKLSPGGCASIEQHLMRCDSCGDALDRLTIHASLLEHLRGQQGPSSDDTVVPTLDGWVRELKERNPFGAVSDDELLRRGWLGRYQITGKLGAGGMGAVYRAYHPVLRCERGLKVLPRGLAENPAVVERFRRDARTICRFNHPNIVRAYDTDSVDDLHFLLMEYVPGTDLGRLVKEKGPLPVAVACDYVRQAALGLQHAHENGMVHRDIKPQNLLLHE